MCLLQNAVFCRAPKRLPDGWNAFTAGVKPGGLNSSTEIRILLCYLIKNAASPLTGEELEAALLNEGAGKLLNLRRAFPIYVNKALWKNRKMAITFFPKGREVADTLQDDVPLTVRVRLPRGGSCTAVCPKAPSTKCIWKRHQRVSRSLQH